MEPVIKFLKSQGFTYVIKCMAGLSIAYWFYIRFPGHQFYWALISVLLVIAPDDSDSAKLAFDRIKANIVGSVTGLILFFINWPGLILLLLGIVITIAICSILKLLPVARLALAAMLIVMLREKSVLEEMKGLNIPEFTVYYHSVLPSEWTWQIALERMGCVMLGCLIALAVSVFSAYVYRKLSGMASHVKGKISEGVESPVSINSSQNFNEKTNFMEYKTADLCDAYHDKVTITEPIGFKDYGGRKMFSGEIHTVKTFEDHAPVEKALNTDGRGKVLVVDGGGSMRCALTGDRLGGIAVKNNWNGIIINGCIRDSAGLALLDLGIKALNTYPISRVTGIVWEENIPLVFAGGAFIPGHHVYCDEDGIIISPESLSINN